MLVVALVVLGVGTLLAALATSIGVLIVGRVIQGAGGAIFPLAFGIIRDEFPRERVAQRDRADLGDRSASAAASGIVLAGPIVDALSLPLAVLVPAGRRRRSRSIATVLFVPESPVKTPGRVNWVGAALLSALAGRRAASAISEGSTWGWGDAARARPVRRRGACCSVVWVARRDARRASRWSTCEMMRIRGVWTVNAAAFLVGAGMYSSFILIPQFVETPTSAGLRLRRLGHRGRPVPAARRRVDDADRQPDRRAAGRARRLARRR